MGDNDPASRQNVLDHPQAERKPKIQPDRMSNDFSGKAMAAIEGITVCHGPSSHIEFQLFVKLTMPKRSRERARHKRQIFISIRSRLRAGIFSEFLSSLSTRRFDMVQDLKDIW
jgi:hypothetical protein